MRKPETNEYDRRIFAEQMSPVYNKDKTNYIHNPSRVNLYHFNVIEHGIHFWRIGGKPEGHGTCLQNRAKPLYGLFWSNTNVFTEIPNHSFVKTAFDIEAISGRFGRCPMLRPEQYPILLMGFIIREITKRGDTVLDPFMGTEATSKACFLKHKHLNLTDCDGDSGRIIKIIPFLFSVFAENGFNPVSVTTESESVQKAANQYYAGKEVSSVEHIRGVWKVPRGLCSVQFFREHFPMFLGEFRINVKIFEKASHLSSTEWSEKCLARLNLNEKRALLVHEC